MHGWRKPAKAKMRELGQLLAGWVDECKSVEEFALTLVTTGVALIRAGQSILETALSKEEG